MAWSGFSEKNRDDDCRKEEVRESESRLASLILLGSSGHRTRRHQYHLQRGLIPSRIHLLREGILLLSLPHFLPFPCVIQGIVAGPDARLAGRSGTQHQSAEF